MFNKQLSLHGLNKSISENFYTSWHVVEMHSILYYMLLTPFASFHICCLESPLDLGFCKTSIPSSSSSHLYFFPGVMGLDNLFQAEEFIIISLYWISSMLLDTVVLIWLCIFCLFILMYPFWDVLSIHAIFEILRKPRIHSSSRQFMTVPFLLTATELILSGNYSKNPQRIFED